MENAPERVSLTPQLSAINAELIVFLSGFLKNLESRWGRNCQVEIILMDLEWLLEQVGIFHSLVDRYFSAANASLTEPIQCRSGCGTCCNHFPSTIEAFEVLNVYADLRRKGELARIVEACYFRINEMNALLSKYKIGPEDDDERALTSYFQKAIPCVFLKDGSCSIYSIRPVSCRMYFSLSAPEFCSTEHLESSKNRNFIHYFTDEVELLIDKVGHFFDGFYLSADFFRAVFEMNSFEADWENRPNF